MKALFIAAFALLFLLAHSPSLRAQSITIDREVDQVVNGAGGRENLARISTLRLSGQLTSKGRTLPFVIYRKKPNLFRREITLEDGSKLIHLYDGHEGWEWTLPESDKKVEKLSPSESALLRLEARFSGPLIDFDERDGFKVVGELARLPHYNGLLRPFIKRHSSGLVEEVYVDSLNYWMVATSLRNSTTAPRLEIYFSEFKVIERVRFPTRITAYFDGKLMSETQIKAIDVNFSIYSFFFRKPD